MEQPLQEQPSSSAAAAPPSPPKLEAILFKGTTLPHIVVRRRCVLQHNGFVTYQVDKGLSTGKAWPLHRRATLEPDSSRLIRTHERHLRKAGPLRALSAYARDKNVLKLFCFRVEWPDKYAPSQASTVELGFETLAEAQEWYEAVQQMITGLATSLTGSSSSIMRESNGSISGHLITPGDVSVEPSPFASPIGSFPNTPHVGVQRTSFPGVSDSNPASPSPTRGAADAAAAAAVAAGSAAAAAGSRGNSHSGGGAPAPFLRHSNAGGGASGPQQRLSASGTGAVAGVGAGGAMLHSNTTNGGQLLQDGLSAGIGSSSSGIAAAALSAGIRGRAAQGNGRASAHHSSSSTTGVVVDDRMVRWVPYKHANGMAIYYRQTPADEGISQASGEYMLSTTVQASPDCCLGNLMLKADKHGSILSTAAFMEVLEDNGDMQVWHMVFYPAGHAGLATVLAAPRYSFMHQVHTTYEDGVHAVLFSSVPDHDVKPEWVERARARMQSARRAVLRSDPGSGSRRALWKTPVRCNITGAITLSALEGRSGRDSPQTLVTCIVRADWGGWLSSKSVMYGLGQSLGLQEALMDRVLMRVMILKEDVEYSRFTAKPFQFMMVTDDADVSTGAAAGAAGGGGGGAAASGSSRQQDEAAAQQIQQISQHHSAAAAAAAAALRQGSLGAAGSGSLPSAAAAAAGAGGTGASAATAVTPSTPPAAAGSGSGGLQEAVSSSSGSRSAAAAAAAAAARVSAAASALAAHMTNPQQLWNEKRGSGSGLRSRRHSSGSTPPRSPLRGGSTAVSDSGPFAVAGAVSCSSSIIGSQLQQQGQQPLSSDGGFRPKVGQLKSSQSAPEGPTTAQQLQLQQQNKWLGAGGAAAAAGGAGALSAAGAAEQQQQPGGLLQHATSSAAGADEFESFTDASEYLAGSSAASDTGSYSTVGEDSYSGTTTQQQQPQQPHLEAAAATASTSSSSLASSSDQQQQGQQQQDDGLLPYTEAELGAMIAGTLNRQYWEPIHDGAGSVRDVYSIRGPNYLRDRKKIPAGKGRYKLLAADLVATHGMMDHVGRFLPSVRMNGAAFSFVVDLIINYGSPVLHLVMVFSTDRHPNSLGPCPDDPLDAGEEWSPFDFTMSRFLHGSDEERNGMFKLIPHCAKGSWVVSQSVGTTPVILGRKLATTYHQCERYIEVDVDVASTPAVSYIVKMVQGATRSMLIDHAYLLESHFAHELPETLIGAIRYKHLHMTDFRFINVDQELPFSPVVPGIVGQ